MTAISGQGGSVKVGAVVAANLDTWSLDLDAAIADITPFQSPGGWKTNISTIKSWSGKATGRFDSGDTTGQLLLINGLGTQFAMSFMTDAVHMWAGNALLAKVIPKSDASGVVTAEFDLTGTGACTYS